jgi:cell shape-determining protein MreC
MRVYFNCTNYFGNFLTKKSLIKEIRLLKRKNKQKHKKKERGKREREKKNRISPIFSLFSPIPPPPKPL